MTYLNHFNKFVWSIWHLRNRKHVLFLSSYRNMSESLGECEMLWEQKAAGECFHVSTEFSQTFTSVSKTQ